MQTYLTGSATAVSTHYLVSLAECVNFMQDQNFSLSTTSSATGFLNQCIGIASLYLENKTNGPLKTVSYYSLYNGDGLNFIQLDTRPIQTVTAIKSLETITGNAVSAITLTPIYKIEYDKIYFPATFTTPGVQNYSIEYTAGFTDVKLEGLKWVVLDMVSLMFYESRKSGDDRFGVSSKNLPSDPSANVSYNFEQILKRHEKTIKQFTRI